MSSKKPKKIVQYVNRDIWDDDYSDYDYQTPTFRSKNLYAPPGVHIMNKNEKEALRKIKKETGLSEEEIRKEKKYRIILSEAQKKQGTKDEYDRNVIKVIKSVTKKTKLSVEHPDFKKELKKELDDNSTKYTRYFKYGFTPPSPENLIYQYLHLRKKQKNKKNGKI